VRVQGSGFRVQGSGLKVYVLGFGFWVWGLWLGFRLANRQLKVGEGDGDEARHY
jgi:hypothetical protein